MYVKILITICTGERRFEGTATLCTQARNTPFPIPTTVKAESKAVEERTSDQSLSRCFDDGQPPSYEY